MRNDTRKNVGGKPVNGDGKPMNVGGKPMAHGSCATRWLALVAVALAAMELLVVLGSWMVAAAWPELPVRSLISLDGVRWLFGAFVSSVSTPLLVWLVVLSMGAGAVADSGLASAIRRRAKGERLAYRERTGLALVAAEWGVAALLLVLMTCLPHALLLNAMGHLYPSAFSASAVPVLAFALLTGALTYGAASGTLATLSSAYHAATAGLSRFAPVFPVYVLAAHLAATLRYALAL